MAHRMQKMKKEGGVALIIVLIVLLVLSTLIASMIFATNTEVWASANYRLLAQARYAAEAGAQNTANQIIYNVAPTAGALVGNYDLTKSPVVCNVGCSTIGGAVVLSATTGVNANYPDAAQQTAFNNALNNQALPGLPNVSFSTTATLMQINANGTQTWRITSVGNVTGVRAGQVQVVETIERPITTTPMTTYAVFATGTTCPTITLFGGATTDSYDSSQGTYATTNQANDGNVGTNGNLTVGGNPTLINGTASFGAGAVTTGACPNNFTNGTGPSVVQGTVALGGPQDFPPPVYTNPSPAITANQNYTNNQALTPGNYGNVSMSGGKTLTLAPGTYNFNSLAMSGNSTLIVSPAGQVIINIAGCGNSSCSTTVSQAIDFSGGTIINSTGTPINFQILYNGTAPMTLSGGMSTAAVVYAPNSPITISGGAPWYGAIVGNTFTDSGGAAVHFDRALLKEWANVALGKFNVTSFNWSKF